MSYKQVGAYQLHITIEYNYIWLLIILAKYSPGTRDKNALSFMGSIVVHGMFIYL